MRKTNVKPRKLDVVVGTYPLLHVECEDLLVGGDAGHGGYTTIRICDKGAFAFHDARAVMRGDYVGDTPKVVGVEFTILGELERNTMATALEELARFLREGKLPERT